MTPTHDTTEEPTLTVERPSPAEALRAALIDGPRPVVELLADLAERGVSEPQARRAKRTLGVVSRKEGFDPGVWWWELVDHMRCPTCRQLWPDDDEPDGQPAPPSDHITLTSATAAEPPRLNPSDVDGFPWCPSCRVRHSGSYTHCSTCGAPSMAPRGLQHAGCGGLYT